ncbi:MAG: hypothetical protein JSW58_14490 [Candidatus Latescibacterota bacterium]|nr:MAG: hypothetical protein JSW58_14490 [Candidatus Latescibacterota bacterium]
MKLFLEVDIVMHTKGTHWNPTRYVSGALGTVVILAVVFLSGCQDSSTTCPCSIPLTPSGSLIDFTGCKPFEDPGDGPPIITPVTADCIMYRYDGVSTLRIIHVNAGFNCCPGDLIADIDIANHVITITENETESACRCLCLYDVEYEIVDLVPGEYTIRFIELYTTENDEILECTVDLVASPSGLHCIDRDHYPWGDGTTNDDPNGRLVGATGCKSLGKRSAIEATPSNQDCIDYVFNDGVMLLTHINAGFNCCPVIGADITIVGNVITITETEIEGLCDCLCLFDLDYEIRNLPPGEYEIVVIEPYLQEGDDPLEFTAELFAAPSGSFCVERDHYPWGL